MDVIAEVQVLEADVKDCEEKCKRKLCGYL